MGSNPGRQVLFSQAEIQAAVDRLAGEINHDYRGKNPVIIGVLKGVFVFMADLVRRLNLPLEIEFFRLSSYGSGRETSGKVGVVQDLQCPVEGRDVLIIEDIVDTGITANFLMEYLNKKKPASLRLCALLDKPSRRKTPVNIDYLGLTVPDKFIVGYGLDCDERYRNLPDLWYLED
jgi:hypoxanthine phosphoribosyltransferase